MLLSLCLVTEYLSVYPPVLCRYLHALLALYVRFSACLVSCTHYPHVIILRHLFSLVLFRLSLVVTPAVVCSMRSSVCPVWIASVLQSRRRSSRMAMICAMCAIPQTCAVGHASSSSVVMCSTRSALCRCSNTAGTEPGFRSVRLVSIIYLFLFSVWAAENCAFGLRMCSVVRIVCVVAMIIFPSGVCMQWFALSILTLVLSSVTVVQCSDDHDV